jgi:hypothetical protein
MWEWQLAKLGIGLPFRLFNLVNFCDPILHCNNVMIFNAVYSGLPPANDH